MELKFLDREKVLLGLSGGINSAAILCYLKEQGINPKELHLFYAHFEEHSPDTFKFVADGIRFARKHFSNVHVKITRNSIIRYFDEQKIIPHPKVSPCSQNLKAEPIERYSFENWITVDLVGYVKKEIKTRLERQQKIINPGLFDARKEYPIQEFDDEWCFEIVQKNIGWYPLIYDIKDEKGRRLFTHNNCLPCKNMQIKQIKAVKRFYREYYDKAMALSGRLKSYWGRSEADFYTEFGRDLGEDVVCEVCSW